jgi:hypothetical protein
MIYYDIKEISIDEIECPEYSFYISVEDNKKLLQDARKIFKLANMKHIIMNPRMLFSTETNKKTYPILGKEFKLTIIKLIHYSGILFAIVKLKKNWTCMPFPYLLLLGSPSECDKFINTIFINDLVQIQEQEQKQIQRQDQHNVIYETYNTEIKINVKLGLVCQRKEIINQSKLFDKENHDNVASSNDECINEEILPCTYEQDNNSIIIESDDEIMLPDTCIKPKTPIDQNNKTNEPRNNYTSKPRFVVNKSQDESTIRAVHKTHEDYDKEIANKFSSPKIKSKLHSCEDEILILPDAKPKIFKGPRGGSYITIAGKKKYIPNKR